MKLLIYYVNVGILSKEKAEEHLRHSVERFKEDFPSYNTYCKIVGVPVVGNTHFELFDLS